MNIFHFLGHPLPQCGLWLLVSCAELAAQAGGGPDPLPGADRAPILRQAAGAAEAALEKLPPPPGPGGALCQGAIVTLRDALAKAALTARTPLPEESLWNDVALRHVLQEPWFQQRDERQVGAHSPVSPAFMLLRDNANTATAPATHLLPCTVRPPFLYFPVPVNVDGNPAYDSPHFRLIFVQGTRGAATINAATSAKLITKLEDSLAIMRLMPIHFPKAEPRDTPFKLTIELTPSATSRTAVADQATANPIRVDGDFVSITASSSSTASFGIERDLVSALVAYLLDPLPVNPVIQSGLVGILAAATALPEGQEPAFDKTTAADRKQIREDERAAAKLTREQPRTKGPKAEPPRQRIYSFTTLEDTLLKSFPANAATFTAAVTGLLEKFTSAKPAPKPVGGVTPTRGEAAATALVTWYFLFGDNDGDPVHLQNYFSALQLHGSEELATANLFYGSTPEKLCSAIHKWASR